MNLSTVMLLLLAWQMLSGGKKQNAPKKSLSDLFNDDTKNIFDCVEKLTDKEASKEDKTGAIFQMMTNPAVMDLAGKFFSKKEEEKKEEPLQNEEGYNFEQPSADSREFFRPIENIADAEVKHRLYRFYDNWYVK